MTDIDLTELKTSGPSIKILGKQSRIISDGVGTVFSGFEDFDRCTIKADVPYVAGRRGATITLIVEQSDGSNWEEITSWAFTRGGTRTIDLDAPSDLIRARWTVNDAVREATIRSVLVYPGTIDQPSSSEGGSQPQNAVYSGFTGVSINDGFTGQVPFESLDQGPALLDITDPANPEFIDPGVYAVSVSWYADAPPTAGGTYGSQFAVDELGTSLTITNIYGPNNNDQSGWFTGIAVIEATYEDGGTLGFINLAITNQDGDGVAHTFVLSQAVVSKIG